MSAVLFASAFLALLAPQKANINLVLDAKTGDVISGERTFRVKVESQVAINQVEFYINDELRDTASSVPYEFKLDTIAEKEGDIKLKFKAYTVENKTGESTITLKIDNLFSKGLDYHVQKAEDFLSDSKWNDALAEGRIALKIDPKSNKARIALARANLGKNILDQAQKYAEDAVAQDPNDQAALQLLSSINLYRSFNTIAKEGSDPAETRNAIREALKNAVNNRKKSLELDLDKIGAPTAENILRYADAAIRAERYSLAASALTPFFEKDVRNGAIANRLAYAQMRAYRAQAANTTLTLNKKEAGLDAYGYALHSVILLELNSETASDDAIREALLADGDNIGVKTAQAFAALKRNRTQVLSKLTADLVKDQGQRADVNYFLMALSNRQQQFGNARKYFQRAVMAEPAYSDLYVEQGNYSISLTLSGKLDDKAKDALYESAKLMYETALLARPESADALCGMSIVSLLQNKPRDAVKYGEIAVRTAPNDAATHYTLSAAYSAIRNNAGAQAESLTAGKLDKKNLEGRELPKAIPAWLYLSGAGRLAVIAAPK